MRLTTIEQMNDFANSLLYKLSSSDLPENIAIWVDLSMNEFNEFQQEMAKVMNTNPDLAGKDKFSRYTYQYLNVKFIITTTI